MAAIRLAGGAAAVVPTFAAAFFAGAAFPAATTFGAAFFAAAAFGAAALGAAFFAVGAFFVVAFFAPGSDALFLLAMVGRAYRLASLMKTRVAEARAPRLALMDALKAIQLAASDRTGGVKLALAQYRELAAFAQFASLPRQVLLPRATKGERVRLHIFCQHTARRHISAVANRNRRNQR